MTLRALLPLALAAIATAGDAPGWVWVEAESATDKREQKNDWYEPVDRATSLSASEWWRSFDEIGTASGYAVVPFSVPRAGKWRLWIRANLSSTGATWQLDDGAVQELPLSAWQDEDRKHENDLAWERRVYDRSIVSHDGTNRHTLAWLRCDELDLNAGAHRLRLMVKPGKDGKGFAAVDCFVLAESGFDFRPRMAVKPGDKVQTISEMDPAKAWPFPTTRDAFGDSPIDLRRLNEKSAGEHGFIGRSPAGAFVRGDGQPIRFWAGSEYAWRIPFDDGVGAIADSDRRAVAHKARWLAKRGINMVRFHGHLPPMRKGNESPPKDGINDVDLHGAWYMVAAFKQEGIYSTISPYWGSHTDNEKTWDLGFDGGNLSGLVFYYEPVQRMYRAWLKRLYTDKNPYTGIPLKDDPALAIIQLQNEDSLLFYTAGSINGEPLRVLTKQFGDFAAKKHGSLEKAFARYTLKYESGWDLRGKDDLAAGTVAVLQPWFMTLDARNRAKKWEDVGTRNRLDDQLEFTSRLMYDFNAATAKYLREDLGCRQLINAGNWRTVDPVTCDDAERWSYTANEVIGRNVYFNGIHRGINEGWQILTQHVYTNRSALHHPRSWPTNAKQPVGQPFIIPESLWVPPNLYQSESALLVAAQLSLTGVDTFYWFASGGEEWADVHNKWPFNVPMQLGMFPATALAFREGFIAEAKEPALHEERSLEDIWNQRLPLIAESEAYDPNRDSGPMPTESTVKTTQDPLAFCVGPVTVKLGGEAKNNRAHPRLAELVDPVKKQLRSVTGEIATDFGLGIYTVNAPRCQAAAGFLAKRPEIALADVTIRCTNDYATIVVVPLDGQPLAASKRVLVQVGTTARASGWVVRPRAIDNDGAVVDGLQILRQGSAPWLIANTTASVAIRNPALTRATVLDHNGMQRGAVTPLRRVGGTAICDLPADALYTILSAE